MKQLVREALYHNEFVDEHILRDIRAEEVSCDTGNPDAGWERLAERIRQIDPYGFRSRYLLAFVEANP